MTTWTDSAKTTLDDHLARMHDGLTATGADPMEVTDDLRRHIDEEIAVRRLGVVTTEDVESILQRIGLAQPPLNGAIGRSGTRRESPEQPAPARRSGKWHRALLFFGVALPAITLVLELVTHMCAAAFFDPIPNAWHALLVATVPLLNLAVWWAVRDGRPAGPALQAASCFAILVSAYYSVLYAPMAPFATIAVIFFGWGLLPLSPIFALAAAVRLRVLLHRNSSVPDFSWRYSAAGAALAAIALALTVLPPVLTRHWARIVVEGTGKAGAVALSRLRSFGDERTLLADCYGTTRWSNENPFGLHVQGRPVQPELARRVFYRVTGHAFNEFPPPQLNYTSRGWDVFGELSWDPDQGGTQVGGRLRGLSLGQSRLDGLIDGDAGWAYTEWILEFKNVSPTEREARAQIALPPGGVVSRVTLWVNGEEREAAFAGSAEVRAAYEQVVKVYRKDPILVTHAGEDRILMQCYPVPADGGTIKVRLGITAPLELENESTAILRWPTFLERNFAMPEGTEHSIWLESPQAITTAHPKVAQDHGKPGVFALKGALTDADLVRGASLVRIPRSTQAKSAWVQDPHGGGGGFVRQMLVERPAFAPGRVILVVDGSKGMDESMPAIASALSKLPEGVEFTLLLARDTVEEISGTLRKPDAAFLEALAARLTAVRGTGGQDNLPALIRAWDLATEQAGSVVLWIHGPQPVELENDQRFVQRLEWCRHGDGARTPRFIDLQVTPGPNRLADRMSALMSVHALPRYGSIHEDLSRLFALWRGEARALGWSRERLESGSLPESERGKKSSKHLARLWARDEVNRLVEQRKREEAVRLAAAHQLVTPVSGAVVLETKEQFAQAGLKPVPSDTVPTVPEPGTVLLMALAGLLFFGRRVVRWLKTLLKSSPPIGG